MSKIIGDTTATPNPRPDWLQTDETKADYIKNKPTLGSLASKDVVVKDDLGDDVQALLEPLSSYTENDNGKFLGIAGGVLTWVAIEDGNEEAY